MKHCISIESQKVMPAEDTKAYGLTYLAIYFGDLMRRDLGIGATPKLHELETHVPEFFEKYGNTGIFDEGSIERLHHRMNGNFKK